MADIIKPYRSTTAGTVPSLQSGELAVNIADQKTYIGNGTSSVLVGAGKVSGLVDVTITSPSPNQVLAWNGTSWVNSAAGSGDVVGPSSATDTAIARFNGTTGKTIQNSTATIDSSGNVSALSLRSSGTAANKMPVGTTAQRPVAPTMGDYRFNSTTGEPEWWDSSNSIWVPFADHVSYIIEYLIVAGGGAGGGNSFSGGGGGAGGVLVGTVSMSPGTNNSIVVGAGGSYVTNGRGLSGSNSTAFGLTAIGGGGGAAVDINANGISGGSGGGATYNQGTGGAGTTGQGYRGGSSTGSGSASVGCGGGGAGAQGGDIASQSSSAASNGGIGIIWPIGGSTYYGGGGAGSGYSATASGGLGGGGNSYNNARAQAGTANTGGGGGGGSPAYNASSQPNNGGSGVVILRYPGPQRGTGGTVTSSAGYTYHTFTSSGTFTG